MALDKFTLQPKTRPQLVTILFTLQNEISNKFYLAFILVVVFTQRVWSKTDIFLDSCKNKTYKNTGKENFTLILQMKNIFNKKMHEQSFKPLNEIFFFQM